MNIFTEAARHQIRRTLASMIINQDVEELDFLSDERIWAECWILLEVDLRCKVRMVPPAHQGAKALPLTGVRIMHVFDIFLDKEPLFEDNARTELAKLPHGETGRYRVNNNNHKLEHRKEGDDETKWFEATDIMLWCALVSIAEFEIQYSDDRGVWIRNCFAFLEKNGTLPKVLLYKEELD